MIKLIFLFFISLVTVNMYSQNDTIFLVKNSKLYHSVYRRDSSEGYIFKISNHVISDTIWKIDNLILYDWILYSDGVYLPIKFTISNKGKLTYVIDNVHRNFIILSNQILRLNNYPIQGQNTNLYINRETEEFSSKNGKIKLKNNF